MYEEKHYCKMLNLKIAYSTDAVESIDSSSRNRILVRVETKKNLKLQIPPLKNIYERVGEAHHPAKNRNTCSQLTLKHEN